MEYSGSIQQQNQPQPISRTSTHEEEINSAVSLQDDDLSEFIKSYVDKIISEAIERSTSSNEACAIVEENNDEKEDLSEYIQSIVNEIISNAINSVSGEPEAKLETLEESKPEFNEEDQNLNQTSNLNLSPTKNSAVPIPQQTPVSRKSMIPIQSHRKAPVYSFETPNVKMSKRRLDELFQSGIKKPKEEEDFFVPETPSRRISSTEFQTFINRSQKVQEHRKLKAQKLREELDKRERDEIESTRITRAPSTISRRQLRELNERLAPQTCRRNQKENIPPPPQTPSINRNSKVFKRLFEQSTCKKKNNENEDDNLPKSEPVQSIISSHSLHIAMHHEIERISEVIGDKNECSKSDLIEICQQLSIIDNATTDSEMEIINKGLERCHISNDVYSAKALKDKLIDSITLRKQRRFNRLIKRKLIIARANEKIIVEQQEPVVEEVKCAPTMQKETFERLLSARPTIVAEPDPETNVKIVALSKKSEKILMKSQRTKELQAMSLDERGRYLQEMKMQSIKKLEEEIIENENKEMQTPDNLGMIPEFYSHLPSEIKQRKKKNEIEEKKEVDFKPKTNSYEEYRRRKERQEKAFKPIGWDESVQRIRLGRLERNEIQNALDPRAGPIKMTKLRRYMKNRSKKIQEDKSSVICSDISVDEIDNHLGI
ncbi:hypothetical protein GPJ56_007761 [Histomonas meleagridis]|uniref:uncharacterized protein n=1 Tax=Histomonas meleagridis TaxID=135588 RepID=UPI00355A08AE|nr:hypothetical protein GPJ56_007761 [Histomonas meleagridis]KAH0798760.1 hypothetical protein GO595_008625 [Histomonas meleagridis]